MSETGQDVQSNQHSQPQTDGFKAHVHAMLASGVDPSIVGRHIMDTAGLAISNALALRPPVPAMACRRGCTHCCHQGVDVTVPEIFTIISHVEATRSAEERQQLAVRLQDVADRTRGLTPVERQELATACAFLGEDDSCTIHEVRPALCRAVLADDPGLCQRAFRQQEIGAEKVWPEPVEAVKALLIEAAAAWSEFRGGGGLYELHALFAVALRQAVELGPETPSHD